MFESLASIFCPKKVILRRVSSAICSKRVILRLIYVPNRLLLKMMRSERSKKVIVNSQIGYSFSYKTVIVVHED